LQPALCSAVCHVPGAADAAEAAPPPAAERMAKDAEDAHAPQRTEPQHLSRAHWAHVQGHSRACVRRKSGSLLAAPRHSTSTRTPTCSWASPSTTSSSGTSRPSSTNACPGRAPTTSGPRTGPRCLVFGKAEACAWSDRSRTDGKFRRSARRVEGHKSVLLSTRAPRQPKSSTQTTSLRQRHKQPRLERPPARAGKGRGKMANAGCLQTPTALLDLYNASGIELKCHIATRC
jgi:hypothetical protein